MDFSPGSMGVSLGLAGSNLGFGDRGLLANLTSEMAENRARMLAQNCSGLLLPTSGVLLKQSRSGSEVEVEMEMESKDEGVGPLKMARSHSFSAGSYAGSALLVRSTDNERLPCSPSSTSEDAFLATGHAAHVIAGEPRLISPPYVSPSLRHLSYRQDPYFYKSSGMHMAMARENMNMYDAAAVAGRYYFTSAQWAELEHQALVYKYIVHGYPVPEDLLLPIRRSVAALSGLPYGISGVGWGSFNLGSGCNVDAEPGRCRRTDGKKWRCSRPVVPDQKYCERHMHRGRHRSRKAAEVQAASMLKLPPSPSPISRSPAEALRVASPQHSSLAHSPNSIISSKPTTIAISQQQIGSPLSTKALLHLPSTVVALNSNCSSSLNLPTNHFQLPPQSPTASLAACKDQRFRAQQVLASEAFENPCMMAIEQQQQLRSRLSVLPSTRVNTWPGQLSKIPSLIPQKTSSNPLYLYDSSMLSQDMRMTIQEAASPLSHFDQQKQQQQVGYFTSKNTPIVDHVKSENQPLRHFFDDWPRSRDSSWSDPEEEKHKTIPNASSSSTQLSISIATAPDLASANASPTRKNMFSPLRLCMSRAHGQDGATDPTHMGLGIALGSNSSACNSLHQSVWFPMENSHHPMGGPLAEALQSSTPLAAAIRGGGGLNFLGTGELGSRLDSSSPQESSRLPSPTGVLQKTFGCCFSDSSSSASSPASASAKPEAVACDQNLRTHLSTNGSPHVAT